MQGDMSPAIELLLAHQLVSCSTEGEERAVVALTEKGWATFGPLWTGRRANARIMSEVVCRADDFSRQLPLTPSARLAWRNAENLMRQHQCGEQGYEKGWTIGVIVSLVAEDVGDGSFYEAAQNVADDFLNRGLWSTLDHVAFRVLLGEQRWRRAQAFGDYSRASQIATEVQELHACARANGIVVGDWPHKLFKAACHASTDHRTALWTALRELQKNV